jgi:Holliday junction resolvase
MATPFQKGASFENYVKRKIEDLGYVARSAGSHGAFDLILIREGTAYGVQCKKGRISKREKEHLIKVAKKYGMIPIVATKEGRFVVFVNLFTQKTSRNFEEVIS